MTNNLALSIAFWALLGATVLMRLGFAIRSGRTGRPLLPDRAALLREGPLAFAMRLLLSLFLAALLFHALHPLPMKPWALPEPAWLRWIGAALGFASLGFWFWTHAALGSLWSPNLELQPGHRMVTTGPYARIRHPMYTAIIGWMAGLALLAGDWALVALAAVASAFLMARAPREEQMRVECFGDAYRDYMRRTGRFLPR